MYAGLSDWVEEEQKQLPAYIDSRLTKQLRKALAVGSYMAGGFFPFWKQSNYEKALFLRFAQALEPLPAAGSQVPELGSVLLAFYDWLAMAERLLRFWERTGLPFFREDSALLLRIESKELLELEQVREIPPLLLKVYRRLLAQLDVEEEQEQKLSKELLLPAYKAAKKGQYEQSIDWLKHLLKNYPQEAAQLFRRMGEVYTLEKRFVLALEAYSKALLSGYPRARILHKMRRLARRLSQSTPDEKRAARWRRIARSFKR